MTEQELIKTIITYNAYFLAFQTFLELKGLTKEADEFAVDYLNRLTEKDIKNIIKNLGLFEVEEPKKRAKKNGKKV